MLGVCISLGLVVVHVSVQSSQDGDALTRKEEPHEILSHSTAAQDTSRLTHLRRAAVPPQFELSRIQDPLLELVADADITQIHHGIYKVTASSLRDGNGALTFALKTECRPAQKWHGQQGWSEVAVYHFTQQFYGNVSERFATAPPARGVAVLITPHMLANVVHKDRCGVLDDKQIQRLASLRGHSVARTDEQWRLWLKAAKSRLVIVGVALTWQPRHDDNALPPKSFRARFLPPPSSSNDAILSAADREVVSQISDVSLMDYLLSNEDREEKNWFFDANHRYVMMDNGWAFAGRRYEGSICSDELPLLECPPLFRHLDSATCTSVVNCRFRRETIDRLRVFGAEWETREAPRWRRALLDDPLVALFVDTYGDTTVDKKGKRLQFNEGLARYTQGCPSKPSSGNLVSLLEYGLKRRMAALKRHTESCVERYGERYVFG